MSLAPVALFVYNRPAHVARTLAALQACELAHKTDLHVFSDGSKNLADNRAVEAVRTIIEGVTGFASVSVRTQPRNLGLAQSIMQGVTELCDRYGRVIALEDDLIAARGFLPFMNQALAYFADVPRVMQISGYMFPIARAVHLGDVFLSQKPASWGWATWKRAWSHFNPDSNDLVSRIRQARAQSVFDMDGGYPYFEMLEKQAAGQLDVWGVRWYASMFVRQGLCLYPTQSLVSNVGMDGSGIHCVPTTAYDVSLSSKMAWDLSLAVEESAEGRQLLKQFDRESLAALQPSVVRRAINKLQRLAKSCAG